MPWTFETQTETRFVVFPDGCRDLIVVSPAGGPQEVFLTEWDSRPRTVLLGAGTTITGWRLRPGLIFDPRYAGSISPDIDELAQAIDEAASVDREIQMVIDALAAPQATVGAVARLAGVTKRTLQRRFAGASLPVPDFWRLLGRARRAARSLSHGLSVSDAAYAGGYSDQAHMTRDFARWFGTSPGRLRRDPVLANTLLQPGLGNWTGEQISIR